MDVDYVEFDVTVLGWGQAGDGELGHDERLENEQVTLPSEITTLKKLKIKSVACGMSHTIFLSDDGQMYSCGKNSFGQLGRSGIKSIPGKIVDVKSNVMVSVACGALHSLCLSDTGQVYSWGHNSYGQLGRATKESNLNSFPRLIGQMSHNIVQIAAGEYHAMALADDGKIWAWGDNHRGQLGNGSTVTSLIPCEIESLNGIPFRQIVCGSLHSLALSVSGALFGWGRNNDGQLGVGHKSDLLFPTLCKTLRTQYIKYVAAGACHTVAIPQGGGLFTFGSGRFGQLGHGSLNDELLPRKVFDLMGDTITQVACGRFHTMVFVHSSNCLQSFGNGEFGQLGLDCYDNVKTPYLVGDPFVNSNKHSNSSRSSLSVLSLFCGGDRSFVLACDHKLNVVPENYLHVKESQKIKILNDEILLKIVHADEEDREMYEEILDLIERLFSSRSCINASFLKSEDEHYSCSKNNNGIDFAAARDGFGILSLIKNENVKQWLNQILIDNLISSLKNTSPDIEALRIFITLPWSQIFDEPDSFQQVVMPFSEAIHNLNSKAIQMLESWWSKFDFENFTRLIEIHKATVVHILYLQQPQSQFEAFRHQKALYFSMEILRQLNKVNEQVGYIVDYVTFYIPEIREKVNIQIDFKNWIKSRGEGVLTPKNQLLSFCDYPFVFDSEAKSILLHFDANLQMQEAVEETTRRNIRSLFMSESSISNPCLVIFVSRRNLVQDTITQLTRQGTADFKKPLKVAFVDEEAVDEGGVKKEFFMLLLREILDIKFGMFAYYEDSRLMWFNEETFEDMQMFGLIGVLCGLAIYNSTICNLSFPLALYKKLLGVKVNLDDLFEIQPGIAKGLKTLLEHESNDLEDVYCLTFAVTSESWGETKTTELIPGGVDIVVTKDNRKQYVDCYLDHYFNSSVKEPFNAFNQGFHKVCGGKVMGLFHPRELKAMVVGNEHYDWDVFEKITEYKGIYHRNHPTIIHFWNVFYKLSVEDKRKFLLFLSGSDRIPIYGMKSVQMHIQPTADENYLPVSHTCFNLLDLPKYTSEEMLRNKLLIAIQYSEGFGLA